MPYPQEKQKNIQNFWDQAQQLQVQGQIEKALAAYRSILEIDGKNIATLHQLGKLYETQGNFAAAIENYRQAIEIDPEPPFWVYRHWGYSLSQNGKLEEAIKAYQKGIKLQPKDGPTYSLLGQAQGRQGNIEKAIYSYRKALEIQPKQPSWVYLNFAEALDLQGDIEGAIEAYEKALDLEPENAGIQRLLEVATARKEENEKDRCYRAKQLQRKGQFDEALAEYRTILAEDYSHLVALHQVALICESQRKWEEAVEGYRKAIEVDAEQPFWVYRHLGFALSQQGDLDGAVEAYNNALKFNPEDASAQRLLGQILEKRGDFNGAVYSDQKGTELNICIVTYEILGPFRNGGIATANSGYARLLAHQGYHVTVLYVNCSLEGPVCLDDNFAHWVEIYKNNGISLIALECPNILQTEAFNSEEGKAWAVDLWLSEKSFDVVHFDEYKAPGFYTIVSKKLGLAHRNTAIIVEIHSGHQWLYEVNNCLLDSPQMLRLLDLEKFCIENPDFLISPSQYLLDWCASKGMKLPENKFCKKNVVPEEVLVFDLNSIENTYNLEKVTELVFFGRHEVRKGLALFCDVVDRLTNAYPNLTITFLGKFGHIFGEHSGSYILQRAENWKNKIKLLTRYNTENAIMYLQSEGRLAVMPSLSENLPTVVIECLFNSIPFVSTSVGGTSELIHPEDLDLCLARPTRDALVDLIETWIETPPNHKIRPSFSQSEARKDWIQFYEWLANEYLGSRALKLSHSKDCLAIG